MSNGRLNSDKKLSDEQKTTPTRHVRNCRSAHSLSAPPKIPRFCASGSPIRRNNTIRIKTNDKTAATGGQTALEPEWSYRDAIRPDGHSILDVPTKAAPGASAQPHDGNATKILDDARSYTCDLYDTVPILLSSHGDSEPHVEVHKTLSRLNSTPILGLGVGLSCPSDFSLPLVRPYPTDQWSKIVPGTLSYLSPLVQHIDVTTIWNGLPQPQSERLFQIHKSFVASLEALLAEQVRQIIDESQDQLHQKITTNDFKGPEAAVTDRCIAFCREKLILDTVQRLHEYPQYDEKGQAQLSLVELYLASIDCLVEYHESSRRDTSLLLHLQYQAPEPSLNTVQAAWIPDDVLFPNLNGFPREGEEFQLIPVYQCNSVFRKTCFPTNVFYTVETPCSWLSWDDQTGSFKGLIPIYSALSEGHEPHQRAHACAGPVVDVIELIVRSTLVEYASEPDTPLLRFERTIRTRLTIQVLPWYSGTAAAVDDTHRKPRIYADEPSVRGKDPFGLDSTLNRSLKINDPSFHPFEQKPIDVLHDIDQKADLEKADYGLAIASRNNERAIQDIVSFRLADKHARLAEKHRYLAQKHTDAAKLALECGFDQGRYSKSEGQPPVPGEAADYESNFAYGADSVIDGYVFPTKEAGLQKRSSRRFSGSTMPCSTNLLGEVSISGHQHSSLSIKPDIWASAARHEYDPLEHRRISIHGLSRESLDDKVQEPVCKAMQREDSTTHSSERWWEAIRKLAKRSGASKTGERTTAPNSQSLSSQGTGTLVPPNRSESSAGLRLQVMDEKSPSLDISSDVVAGGLDPEGPYGRLPRDIRLSPTTSSGEADIGDCSMSAEILSKIRTQGDIADAVHEFQDQQKCTAPPRQDLEDESQSTPGYPFYNTYAPLGELGEDLTSAGDLSDDACVTIRPTAKLRQQRTDVRDYFQPRDPDVDNDRCNVGAGLCNTQTESCKEKFHPDVMNHVIPPDLPSPPIDLPSANAPYQDETIVSTTSRASTPNILYRFPNWRLKKRANDSRKWCTCDSNASGSCHLCKSDRAVSQIGRYWEQVVKWKSDLGRKESMGEKQSEMDHHEPRLSRDEQAAMQEAIRRSLGGHSVLNTMEYSLADNYDDIFDNSSDESWNAADDGSSEECEIIVNKNGEKEMG